MGEVVVMVVEEWELFMEVHATPKPGEQNYSTISDSEHLPNQWSLLTWEDQKKFFKLWKDKNRDDREIKKTATAVVEIFKKLYHSDIQGHNYSDGIKTI